MKELENQKELIFNTAKNILLSEDINKFSIRMISSRCNIGIGTIYKYYGNKTDILIDITRDLWTNYILDITTNVDPNYSFIERIEFYYTMLVQYSEKFNYEILSKELSNSFKKIGRSKHDESQIIFTILIKNDIENLLSLDTIKQEVLADFIANNLIALITMKTYTFKTFNDVLKVIIKEN